MRPLRALAAGVAFGLVNCSAIADDDGRWLPNKAVTPGAIAETRRAPLRIRGYASGMASFDRGCVKSPEMIV
jgi:hypothetical protein